MAAIVTDLPSILDETFAACARFRILVIGKSGVGKSSLVSNIFNIDVKDIDIRHDSAGNADITYGYTSTKNIRFILHDSLGFEPGTVNNWKIVEDFLRQRSATSLLQDRVHAIWLCIEAPRTGSRVQETSDENLLELAKELKIPVIVVFTKYDMLVNECYQEALIAKVSQSEIDSTSERAADIRFNNRIGDFRTSSQVPCVKVSTDEEYPEKDRLRTLEELVNITRNCLHEVEGDLWILWATTQQISAQQKIERSISEGYKKYWLNLGRSSVFQDHYLIDCLRRIHDDILKIWNFHDPDNLLSGDLFFAQMIRLVEPLLSGYENSIKQDDSLSQYSNMMSLVKAVSTGLAHVLGGVGIGIVAFKFLYGKYQKIPLTAGYLGAYIVDLLLVLHRIFTDTLHMDPPRPLSQEIISGALESHKDLHAKMVHDRILAMTSENHLHLERKIGDLIQELLNKK